MINLSVSLLNELPISFPTDPPTSPLTYLPVLLYSYPFLFYVLLVVLYVLQLMYNTLLTHQASWSRRVERVLLKPLMRQRDTTLLSLATSAMMALKSSSTLLKRPCSFGSAPRPKIGSRYTHFLCQWTKKLIPCLQALHTTDLQNVLGVRTSSVFMFRFCCILILWTGSPFQIKGPKVLTLSYGE